MLRFGAKSAFAVTRNALKITLSIISEMNVAQPCAVRAPYATVRIAPGPSFSYTKKELPNNPHINQESTMNSTQLGQQNDYLGLTFIAKFGLLRAQELGLLMWPNTSRTGYPQACRLAKSWLKRGLVIKRIFPEGHGRAFVLSKKGATFRKKIEQIVGNRGAEMAREKGIAYRSGASIGSMNDGVWTPPTSWKHDLISHGVLARLTTFGWTVYPENQIRTSGEWSGKIPDGLAKRPEAVLWLETECAIKNGRMKQRPLVQGLALAAEGRLPHVMGMQPTMAGVALDVDATDARGYRLDHRTRVTSAVKKVIRQDMQINWFECQTKNFGVRSMEHSSEMVRASPGVRVLQIMTASGWRLVPGSDCAWRVQYGAHRVEVGESREHKVFYHQIGNGLRFGAPTLTAAKEAAGNAVAVLNASK